MWEHSIKYKQAVTENMIQKTLTKSENETMKKPSWKSLKANKTQNCKIRLTKNQTVTSRNRTQSPKQKTWLTEPGSC